MVKSKMRLLTGVIAIAFIVGTAPPANATAPPGHEVVMATATDTSTPMDTATTSISLKVITDTEQAMANTTPQATAAVVNSSARNGPTFTQANCLSSTTDQAFTIEGRICSGAELATANTANSVAYPAFNRATAHNYRGLANNTDISTAICPSNPANGANSTGT